MQDRFKILALCVAFSASAYGAFAQAAEGERARFEFDAGRNDTGTIFHYALTLDPKKPAIDYWLRFEEGGAVSTLYDSKRIDGSGVIEEKWRLDYADFRLERARALNIAPARRKAFSSRSRLYDWDARKLHTALEYGEKDSRTAWYETIQADPEIRQGELGIYFTAFFPHLAPDVLPFPVFYDSFGHLVFMTVSYAGEETMNGAACLKYRVRGDDLWSRVIGQGGYVWIAKDDPRHHLVKQTMRMPLTWSMPSFSLALIEELPYSESTWEDLRKAGPAS